MPTDRPAPPPAPRQRPAPRAAGRPGAQTLARLVAPLVGDTLALQRRMAAWGRHGAAGGGDPALAAVFADQLRASAGVLADCVRRGVPAGPRPADRPAAPRRRARAADPVRRLLADEDAVAERLRRTIAVCDGRHDDLTADRLEEVLDEIGRQRGVLRGLVGGASR
jgi:hypothetical protein